MRFFRIFVVMTALVLLGLFSCRHTNDDEPDPDLPPPITVDGIKDAAWLGKTASKAEGQLLRPEGSDLAALYAANDRENLYIALELEDLSGFWTNDRLTLIIDKDRESSGYTGSSAIDTWQLAADEMTFINGQADIYFFHNPTQPDTGASVIHIDGEVFAEDWAGEPEKVTASAYHWDTPDTVNGIPYPAFLEYRFTLTDLGLADGDVIRVFAVVSGHWGNEWGINARDIVPEIAFPDARHVDFDFDAGLVHTIRTGSVK
jgi:hypothetical protein